MYPEWFKKVLSKFDSENPIKCKLCAYETNNYIYYFEHYIIDHPDEQLTRKTKNHFNFRSLNHICERKKSFDFLNHCRKTYKASLQHCCPICEIYETDTLLYLWHVHRVEMHPLADPKEITAEIEFWKNYFQMPELFDVVNDYFDHFYFKGPALDKKIQDFIYRHRKNPSKFPDMVDRIMVNVFSRQPVPYIKPQDEDDDEVVIIYQCNVSIFKI